MTAILTHPIPYQPDGRHYFERLRVGTYPVWLDAGMPQTRLGRYDIMSADPLSTLATTGKESLIISGHGRFTSRADPFQLARQQLAQMGHCDNRDIPFTGGALGYFGYHLGQEAIFPQASPSVDIPVPDMVLGFYEWALIQDHQHQEAYLVAPQDWAALPLWQQRLASPTRATPGPFHAEQWQSALSETDYLAAVARIQDYIQAGDCYQVNLAQRFSSRYHGDSFTAYCQLRERLPAPFAAYMEFAGGALLSHSPERFLQVVEQTVITQPIKGTIARHADPAADDHNRQQLLNSDKDRAENLMIVDLLRNDLSKNCALGSVQTPRLFSLESYANVHHLVSEVRGQLKPDSDRLALLKDCFPGGSITGAPKRRAMEIIDELEPVTRSAYCGSVAYLSSNGRMDSSITIRSLVCDSERIHCWGGGGIVADSDPQAEYQESWQKVRILLEGIQALRQP